jgi:lipopolysaccharide export system permease protein
VRARISQFGIKILDLYIVREVAIPVALSLGVITLALIVARLLKLVDLVVNQGVALTAVLALLGYLLPSLVALSLPMAMLLGTLLGIGRLSSDSEIVAARACGVSLARLAVPVLALAAFIYPLDVMMTTRLAPDANVRLREQIVDLVRTRATAGLPEKVFNRNFDGMVIYFDHAEESGGRLVDVLISDNRNPSAKSIIYAHSGVLIPHQHELDVTLRLGEGWIFGGDNDARHVGRFDTYDIDITPSTGLAVNEQTPIELTMSALRAQIAKARGVGKPDIFAEIELAHRWTIPIAIFPFALLGMTLGLTPVRGGRSERYAFALMLFFSYYVLMRVGEAMALAHVLDAHVAASIPDILFTVVAVAPFINSRIERGEGAERIGDRVRRWAAVILPRLKGAVG